MVGRSGKNGGLVLITAAAFVVCCVRVFVFRVFAFRVFAFRVFLLGPSLLSSVVNALCLVRLGLGSILS